MAKRMRYWCSAKCEGTADPKCNGWHTFTASMEELDALLHFPQEIPCPHCGAVSYRDRSCDEANALKDEAFEALRAESRERDEQHRQERERERRPDLDDKLPPAVAALAELRGMQNVQPLHVYLLKPARGEVTDITLRFKVV